MGYQDLPKIVEMINKLPGKHNIIGHSYGGTAAIDAAAKAEKGKVGILVTLDAVGALPRSDPKNYDQWINVHQEQTTLDLIATVPGVGQLIGGLFSAAGLLGSNTQDDFVATIGGQHGAESGAKNISTRLHHVEAGEMLKLAVPYIYPDP